MQSKRKSERRSKITSNSMVQTLPLLLIFLTGCIKQNIPVSCVVLSIPTYPEAVEWEVCGERACLSLANARLMGSYLAAVERYHKSIEETCE